MLYNKVLEAIIFFISYYLQILRFYNNEFPLNIIILFF